MKPCKLHDGYIDRDGYGRVNNKGKPYGQGAHQRAAYEAYGPCPEGMETCHTCDNRACIESEHLYYGTHSDNMVDRRERLGHKLTRVLAEAVRAKLADGFTQRRVASMFGISQSHVGGIKTRRFWP